MKADVLKERELCCQDMCAACAIAAGQTRKHYDFWISVSPAHQSSNRAYWSHTAHFSNGVVSETDCAADKIRKRGNE